MIESAPEQWTGTTLGKYRLKQLVGQGDWGPIFLAHTEGATTPYLLQLLASSNGLPAREHQARLEQFEHQMKQVATLQHPHILPLLDYGSSNGLFYLVSPYIPMRSLYSRLTKNGPLDMLTTGRYLDQISATLEYAHQNAVIHGGLSVNCIYIRLDGQIVVSGFGISGLLLTEQRARFNQWGGAYAPEQLLNKPVGPYTDVYALGAVIYALLTGYPVFSGRVPEEIAQQHVYATIPPLSRWRAELPAGLYTIVARALSKEPAQRYQRPGALANAYNRNIAPNNNMRVPFIVDSSPVLPAYKAVARDASNGAQTPPPPNGAYAEHPRNDSNGLTPVEQVSEDGVSTHLPAPNSPVRELSVSARPRQYDAERPTMPHRSRRSKTRRPVLFVAVSLILLFAIVTIGFAALMQRGSSTVAPVPAASGQVTFFDQNGPQGTTSAVHITVHGLASPASDAHYAAWLINSDSEQVTALGTLTGDHTAFALTYTEPANTAQASASLLAVGEKFEITLEQGTPRLPVGKVVLVGQFPLHAFQHIVHLLVSFPATPGKVGVLVGTLQQTHLLNAQANVLQSLGPTHNTIAIQCVAQSIIDIIDGSHNPYYEPLPPVCAEQNVIAHGDGFGLLGKGGYITDASEHATYAITQPDATATMRAHASSLTIALTNVQGWVTTIEQDALQLLQHPGDLAKIEEIAMLASSAYYGVDANGNGQIEPIVGEAGAVTAYLQGQLMATIALAPHP